MKGAALNYYKPGLASKPGHPSFMAGKDLILKEYQQNLKNREENKMTKSKKQHVKVLAEVPVSSKKNPKVEDCATVVILPQCKTSKVGPPPCIGCKDDCKYYCQTQSKLNPTPPPHPSSPCNTSDNQKYPGTPLESQKKSGSKKPISKKTGRNAKK